MSDSAAPSFPAAGIALFWLLRALAGNKPARSSRVSIPYRPPAVPRSTLIMPAVNYPPPVPAQWTSDRELLAWRAWRLAYWPDRRQPYLLSLGVPWVWGGPVLTADQLPDAINRSGVHALKASLHRRLDWVSSPHVRVIGWVALSGRVMEHALGYRAERAVIRRLRFSVGMHLAERDLAVLERMARQLEDHYQAPVKMGWTERRAAQRLYKSGCRSDDPAVVPYFPRNGWRVG